MRKQITLIGNGAMAYALANGLKNSYDIEVVGRDSQKLAEFQTRLGVKCKLNTLENFDISDKTAILCVKPANVEEVGHLLQGEASALFSVLAGTTLEMLKTHLSARAYVRAMPNLAATFGKSMTALTGELTCKDQALDIFNAIGHTLWLSSEKELDIATALAGSGPAYLSLIAEALADGAVKQGLKRDDAMALMRGLFDGFGTLIQYEHPALIKDGVMSPGGTTAQGCAALEKGNVRSSCIEAVQAAFLKTQ